MKNIHGFKSILATLLVLGFVPFLLAMPGDAKAAGEYEVEIGGQTYIASDGQPFKVSISDGSQLDVVVRKREILTYNDHGLTFNYHSDMKVLVDKDVFSNMITVECEASPFIMVYIFPAVLNPRETIDSLTDDLRESFSRMNAKFFDKDGAGTITMNIGGKEYSGRTLNFLLGEETTMTNIFAWSKGMKTYGFVTQYMESDRELMEKYFPIILNSFSIK